MTARRVEVGHISDAFCRVGKLYDMPGTCLTCGVTFESHTTDTSKCAQGSQYPGEYGWPGNSGIIHAWGSFPGGAWRFGRWERSWGIHEMKVESCCNCAPAPAWRSSGYDKYGCSHCKQRRGQGQQGAPGAASMEAARDMQNARAESERILTDARRQAEQIVTESRQAGD